MCINFAEFLISLSTITTMSKVDKPGIEYEGGVAVETAKPRLKKPQMYKVVLNNDDYTPMEFVVHILEIFFAMERTRATRVMLQVHNEGKGICGIFPRDIAETKMMQVNEYSKNNNHPLLCSIEAA